MVRCAVCRLSWLRVCNGSRPKRDRVNRYRSNTGSRGGALSAARRSENTRAIFSHSQLRPQRASRSWQVHAGDYELTTLISQAPATNTFSKYWTWFSSCLARVGVSANRPRTVNSRPANNYKSRWRRLSDPDFSSAYERIIWPVRKLTERELFCLRIVRLSQYI